MSNEKRASAGQSLKAAVTGEVSTAVNPASAFKDLLNSRKNEIAAALPKHMTADRVIRLALTEFTKNPLLRECTPQSIYSGIIQASQLGLEIGVLGQAYLVPYNNKIKGANGKPDRWQKEAQFIPGYKGLISLARRSGEVTSIETHIVYDNDDFELSLGINTSVVHKPKLDGNRGKPRLVYGVAHFKDGGHHFEWMSIIDVEKVRARSKAKDSGPWITDFEQMVRKTLIRRMANYLPMSIELAAAIQVDAAVSAGNAAAIDGDFSVIENDGAEPVPEKATEPAQSAAQASQESPGAQESPASGTESPAESSGAPKPLSYAFVADLIKKAKTGEDLDNIAGEQLQRIADEQQRAELAQEIKAKRESL